MNNLKCQKCQQHFDRAKKIPRILPNCGHTFCSQCITQQINQSHRFKCGKCEFLYRNKNDIQFFPINEMIVSFLEDTYEQYELCIKHNKPQEYFCFDHNENICASCAITGQHKDHKVIPLDEIKQLAEQNMKNAEQIFQGIEVTQSIEKMKEYMTKMNDKNKIKNKKKVQKIFSVSQQVNFLNNIKKIIIMLRII